MSLRSIRLLPGCPLLCLLSSAISASPPRSPLLLSVDRQSRGCGKFQTPAFGLLGHYSGTRRTLEGCRDYRVLAMGITCSRGPRYAPEGVLLIHFTATVVAVPRTVAVDESSVAARVSVRHIHHPFLFSVTNQSTRRAASNAETLLVAHGKIERCFRAYLPRDAAPRSSGFLLSLDDAPAGIVRSCPPRPPRFRRTSYLLKWHRGRTGVKGRRRSKLGAVSGVIPV